MQKKEKSDTPTRYHSPCQTPYTALRSLLSVALSSGMVKSNLIIPFISEKVNVQPFRRHCSVISDEGVQFKTAEVFNSTAIFNFNPSAPNQVWVSDITYIRVGGRFYYLCIVIDLFARKVIAYRVSPKMNVQLTIDTFLSAWNNRGQPTGLLFHSDRGCQYTAKEFRKLLDAHDVVQSFSAKAHPYDNAVAESFFKFLKLEETNRKTYCSLHELQLSLFTYIHFYNSQRPHGSNAYLTPNEKELAFEEVISP